jgi:hypothetical protein
MSVLVILAVFSADGYGLAEDVAEKNEDRDPICRRRFRLVRWSYRQILVMARPVRRRRLWADGQVWR